MKSEKITWGLVFIFIGGMLLLNNFHVIHFYWGSIWRFWPITFILIGANMLFSRYDNTTSTILAIVVTVAALAFIGYQGTRPQNEHRNWFHYNDDRSDKSDENNSDWSGNNTFTEAFVANTEKAELNIKGGATSYKLNSTTTNLFAADVKQHFGNYMLEKTSRGSMEVLTFHMRGKQVKWNTDNFEGNEAKISLNSQPIWDINVEMGAGETDFDLTPFKIGSIKLKGGAASFNLKLGKPIALTNVTVETGVAEVNIAVPSSVGCKITVDSGLSSRDFKGFTKQSDGSYTTSNFKPGDKSILIQLKGGLSDFEVNRY